MRAGGLLRAEAAGLASVGGGQTPNAPPGKPGQGAQTQKVKTWEGFTLPGLTLTRSRYLPVMTLSETRTGP